MRCSHLNNSRKSKVVEATCGRWLAVGDGVPGWMILLWQQAGNDLWELRSQADDEAN